MAFAAAPRAVVASASEPHPREVRRGSHKWRAQPACALSGSNPQLLEGRAPLTPFPPKRPTHAWRADGGWPWRMASADGLGLGGRRAGGRGQGSGWFWRESPCAPRPRGTSLASKGLCLFHSRCDGSVLSSRPNAEPAQAMSSWRFSVPKAERRARSGDGSLPVLPPPGADRSVRARRRNHAAARFTVSRRLNWPRQRPAR